jgi:hypothetical protein
MQQERIIFIHTYIHTYIIFNSIQFFCKLNIIIQFNSVLYYLCAESTAVRPITDTAQCTYK